MKTSMDHPLVTEILDRVRRIDALAFDLNDNCFFRELSELTALVWETSHALLLMRLQSMTSPIKHWDVDYALLWYDSLGFPQEIPKTYSKSGEPIYICYGILPSKLNEINFHDAKIHALHASDGYFVCILECYGECIQQVKVTLEDVTFLRKPGQDIYYSECLQRNFEHLVGTQITSAHEVPAIDYIFRNLKFPEWCYGFNKRILLVDGFNEHPLSYAILFSRCTIEYL